MPEQLPEPEKPQKKKKFKPEIIQSRRVEDTGPEFIDEYYGIRETSSFTVQ